METFHKTLKSHAALTKSPTKRVRTQSNHCFMALYAASRLERCGLNIDSITMRRGLDSTSRPFDMPLRSYKP
ncbi:MAG: hypothetical protein J4F35_05230 [Candidatus Latescibacteria bacterium]|nr:hypothetical protein [Candidatus Latescibacterota bacterium]